MQSQYQSQMQYAGSPPQETETLKAPGYNPAADRERLSRILTGSAELDALVSTIEVYNLQSIVTFGASAAEKVAKASDELLRSVNTAGMDESNDLLRTLSSLMSRVDRDDLEGKTGFWEKLLPASPQREMERLDRNLEKYRSLGQEMDQVYVRLRQYESNLHRANRALDSLFEANAACYRDLTCYILAGEQGCREIREYIEQRRDELEKTGDDEIRLELNSLEQALRALERRLHDLRCAEAVALQTIPMIQLMESNNIQLADKIHTAFIVTLPVFKHSLNKTVLSKRQLLQAQSLAVVEGKAKAYLRRQKETAAAAGVNAETESEARRLWDAYDSIVKGIEETAALEAKSRSETETERQRLEAVRGQCAL